MQVKFKKKRHHSKCGATLAQNDMQDTAFDAKQYMPNERMNTAESSRTWKVMVPVLSVSMAWNCCLSFCTSAADSVLAIKMSASFLNLLRALNASSDLTTLLSMAASEAASPFVQG